MKDIFSYIWPFAIGITIFILSLGSAQPEIWDVVTAIFISIGLFRVGIRLLDWLLFGREHWHRGYYDPFLKKWTYKNKYYRLHK